MNIVTFEWVSLGGVDYYTSPKTEEDLSGEYVPLADYQELRRLLERVDAIPHLIDEVREWGYYYQSPNLTQLLSDIKEALK